MSNSAASRALAELEKQLVELSRLRNANTRDSEFKVWRQGTLTLIQRLWEGDDSRSGRFRAVPFSPASTRADSKLTREWFERGCAEAASVLRGLIEEINEHGIIKGPAVTFTEPEPLPEDETVPILSLDSAGSGTGLSSIPDEPDDLRLSDDVETADAAEDEELEDEDEDEIPNIPDPPGARAPKPVSRPMAKGAARSAPQEPAKPAAKPPASKPAAASDAKPPASTKRAAEPQIPISETAPLGPSRGVTVSDGGSAKSGGKKPLAKEKLKDMLGFEPGSRYSPPAAEKSQPATREEAGREPAGAEESLRPTGPAPQAQRPTPTHSPRAATPAPRPAAPAPPAARREPPARPPDLERHGESFGTIAPESVAPLTEGGVSEDFTPTPRPAAPTHTPRAATHTPRPATPTGRVQVTGTQPPPVEPPAEAGSPHSYEEATLQRAFQAALEAMARRRAEPPDESEESEEAEQEDLLESSPVFHVTAKPVQRRGGQPEGRYHTATSIAMAAIATEVEAMGVPATDCSRARAALLELADHFERRDLTWDTVRDAVRLLIAYPVVSRRVLPLLVPHLDEAA
jgi:hypothetical protein